MSVLDKQTSGDLVKLIIFIVVTTLATGVLVVLIGNLTFAVHADYKAVFSDATGVVKGDDIRIAGVKVGSVKSVEIVDRTRALVTFTVANELDVTKAPPRTIRYRNLVGQRYISLTQGVGDLDPLPEDATIPMSRTAAGARPDGAVQRLQAAVRGAVALPTSTSSPTRSIQVFQGEGGNLERAAARTPRRSPTPWPTATRSSVRLIDNLNVVLEHARRAATSSSAT